MNLSFSLQRRKKITLYQSEPGQGPPGLSAYQIWLLQGNEGTVADYLNSLKGVDGQSAYQVWLAAGNEGTEAEFLESLIGTDGEDGLSAYQIWLLQGNEGTAEQFIESLQGEQGVAGEQAGIKRAGTNLQFDVQAVYNSAGAPGSGAFSVDLTGAKAIVQKMYLTGAKTFPAGFVDVGFEAYDPAKVNILFAEYCADVDAPTRVEYWVKVL